MNHGTKLSASLARAIRIATTAVAAIAALLPVGGCAQAQAPGEDGLYAAIHTSKGSILARLEPERTPLAVASFVGLAEGTIANAAFEAGRPFFDGSVFHRVVPGHVIQAGAPSSGAEGPGYTFPNEIHVQLSHDHAGALGVANSGPHTNGSQFYITLADRSYLDGDYIVFGNVVRGMEVVMDIVQGDVVDSVRIVRIGAAAEAVRPTTSSFRAMVTAAERRIAEQEASKRRAERDWIARNWPNATGPADGVQMVRLTPGTGERDPGEPLRVRYRGTQVRYVGHLIGHTGRPLELTAFGSGESGMPGYFDPGMVFTFEPGTTTLNPGLDRVIADMTPGERRVVIVPAALAYGQSGLYTPETPGQPRFVIPPNTMLVYEIEVIAGEDG